MTESSPAPRPKRAPKAAAPVAAVAAVPSAKRARATKPANSGVPAAATAIVAAVPAEPAHLHPNLGLAPADMTAGFPAAADILRRDKAALAEAGLRAAFDSDPEFRGHFDESGTRRLQHDGELLIERLAASVAGNDPRWMSGFAEWLGPILRRRRVSQWDVAALCEGIRETVRPTLGAEEMAGADRALDAAVAVLRKNGRVGGDPHKRNALAKWLYRGV